MPDTYMVRAGGCTVGTVTVHGVVVAVEKPNVDTFVLTFDDGSTRRLRYNQALAVVAAS